MPDVPCHLRPGDRRAALAIVLMACLAPTSATAAPAQHASSLRPRHALSTPPIVVPRDARSGEELPHRLVVKFVDAASARTDGDGRPALRGIAAPEAMGRLEREHGLHYRPLLTLSEARVDAWLARAEQRSGREQPDLLGMFIVEPESGVPLHELAEQLAALPVVEFAYLQPLQPPSPEDFPPTTDDLVSEQGYLGRPPGIDVAAARLFGLTGFGVRVSDCEYDWNLLHEDIVDAGVWVEPGQTPNDPFSDDPQIRGRHGLAVIGILKAPRNS